MHTTQLFILLKVRPVLTFFNSDLSTRSPVPSTPKEWKEENLQSGSTQPLTWTCCFGCKGSTHPQLCTDTLLPVSMGLGKATVPAKYPMGWE